MGLPMTAYVRGSLSFDSPCARCEGATASAPRSPKATRRPSSAITAPSRACRREGSMPRRCAARATSISRTCADACMIAFPLSVSERLPAVTPSSGVRAVSAVTSSMRFGSIPICSAEICSSAVLIPWPSSALPVNTVTLPSAFTRIQASSDGVFSRLPGSFGAPAGCCAATRAGWSENQTTSAPVAARNSRRDGEGACLSGEITNRPV